MASGITEESTHRGIKRSRDQSSHYSSRQSSTGTSIDTPKRKEKRIRQRLETQSLVERNFVSRFSHFEFLGAQERYGKLDTEPSFADPCPYFKQYTELHPPNVESFKPDDWCFVRSNSVVQLNHLDRFNRPLHVLDSAHSEIVLTAASYVEFLLTLDEKIPWPSMSDLGDVPYIGSKFPGLHYALLGYRTRREAAEHALTDAEEAWHMLMQGKRVEPHLNRIAGRGKLAKRSVVTTMGGQLDKGRLIMQTSQRDLYLNGVTEKRLTEAYKSPAFPVSIGSSWWHGGCEEFLDHFRGFDKYWCFDAKKFDASLPGWLVKLAIRIVREQFVEGGNSRYDAYWDFVYEGLVEAPMFLDNGLVFRRFGGTTSGHNHNSLVQSICTLILLYASVAYVVGIDKVDDVFPKVLCEAMGDDQLSGAKEEVAEITKEQLSAAVHTLAGIDWSGDKSFETGKLVDDRAGEFQGVQYLGKYFRISTKELDNVEGYLLPYRPTLETLLRLYYPEHGGLTAESAWERAVGHYLDGAGNPETRDYLEGYLDWLEPQCATLQIVWSEKWRRKFSHGEINAESPMPARRVTYDEWISLVIDQ